MAKSKIRSKENHQSETTTTNSKKKIIIITLIAAIIASAFYILWQKDETKNTTVTYKEKSATVYKFKKEGELTFISADDNFLAQIDIEIAGSEVERTQGLMYRDKMGENQGMFFIFDFETPQSFWMKNTLISLDIIFVNKNNKIVKIHRSTDTLSEQSYPSGAPAIYVVEVNAGYCDKYSIKENDKIVWRRM